MISLIAAIGKNNELGRKNSLIWHLKEDMKFFKNTTMYHSVIMGYNTYLSIGKALPNRRNIVLTRKNLDIPNTIVYHSVEELLQNENMNEEYFVIGGASIYNEFYPLCEKMYLTLINDTCIDADTFFPKFNTDDWEETLISEIEENNIKYKHVLLKRCNK